MMLRTISQLDSLAGVNFDSRALEHLRAEELMRTGRLFEKGAEEPRPALAKIPCEIEARFLIPADRVPDLKLDRLTPIFIRQSYFPRETIPHLLKSFGIDRSYQNVDELTSARLREVQGPQGVTHSIEFKGSKCGPKDSRIWRRELGVPIDARFYSALQPSASAGYLEKLRFEIPGQLKTKSGRVHVCAQVDQILRAGTNGASVAPGFVTVDVELSSLKDLEPLREEKHDFGFLKKKRAIEITAQKDSLSEPLRNKRIARVGLDAEAVRAAKDLSKKCR